MVTLKSFTDDIDQVEHLVKWWVSQSKHRYHCVRKTGTVGDFINDVWAKLLHDFRDGKEIDCKISTIVCQSCAWELGSYRRISDRDRRERKLLFMRKLRNAEKLKSHHRIGCDKYLVDAKFNKELQNAIAEVMRSLTWREAAIVRARYGLFGDKEQTCEEVGRVLKIGRARVNQIECKAIRKIMHHSRAGKLSPYALDADITDIRGKLYREEEVNRKIKQMKRTESGRLLLEELYD